MEVLVGGKRIRTNPSMSIGKGGEADIFNIGNGMALKLFKPPNHPDFQGMPQEQEGARRRIEEHQKKLRAFPKNLPPRVSVPQELATDKKGKIVGYTMPFISPAEVLLRYGEKSFREQGISDEVVTQIFRDLYVTLLGLHKRDIVAGDFNDLNILVQNSDAFVIDADSFQFGEFPCRVFTAKFVDPLLCDPKKTSLELVKPHNQNSDWYAYLVMLMQSLLFVGPYGGVYKPKERSNMIPHNERPLRRITVFHPEVKYPRPARIYEILPDDLLHYLHEVFEKDERGVFPIGLLEELEFTTCTDCGAVHARGICPVCQHVPKELVTSVVRGRVSARKIFSTSGTILFAAYQRGGLHFLYHKGEEYCRESGEHVMRGHLDPHMRFRIRGKDTVVAKGNKN